MAQLKQIIQMATSKSPASRFREFRERAGLTHNEVANSLLISASCIWDIESNDDELSSCYSPRDIQKLCHVLGVRPVELFGGETTMSPISAVELVRLTHEQCHSRGVTLQQFEDSVGWHLSECIEPPEHLFEDITIDGLQWLCRELGVDWRRVLIGL
jgi:transcriptional regulator with XRE-family HTH domain